MEFGIGLDAKFKKLEERIEDLECEVKELQGVKEFILKQQEIDQKVALHKSNLVNEYVESLKNALKNLEHDGTEEFTRFSSRNEVKKLKKRKKDNRPKKNDRLAKLQAEYMQNNPDLWQGDFDA